LQDVDLIEILWKQDVDLGFTISDEKVDRTKESEEDQEKLKVLEGLKGWPADSNSTNSTTLKVRPHSFLARV